MKSVPEVVYQNFLIALLKRLGGTATITRKEFEDVTYRWTMNSEIGPNGIITLSAKKRDDVNGEPS